MSGYRNSDIHLAPGALLANCYKITSHIGGGIVTPTYHAKDLNHASRPVTIKEIIGMYVGGESPLIIEKNFKRDVELLARLDHPLIPKIYQFFFDIEQNRFYAVLEYIAGRDLATPQHLSGNRIDEFTVTKWAIDICDAMDYIHSQDTPIVFHGLEPVGLMIDGQTNRVMLVDFWTNRFIYLTRESVGSFKGTGFSPGCVTGYSPPEHWVGNFDTRSDIYSLGATMFHLLTGSDPTDNPLLIFDFMKNPKPRQLNPAITPEMEEMICKAVEFKPENRFASARAFGQQLKEHMRELQK